MTTSSGTLPWLYSPFLDGPSKVAVRHNEQIGQFASVAAEPKGVTACDDIVGGFTDHFDEIETLLSPLPAGRC